MPESTATSEFGSGDMSGIAHGEVSELLERGGQLAVIRAAVDAVAIGQGRAVVVEGSAGIGKTALLVAARSLACAAGLRPFDARGVELERAYGFGIVRQLLEPAVRDGSATGALGGRARYAAALFEVALAEPASVPVWLEGGFAVLDGLYRLTAN